MTLSSLIVLYSIWYLLFLSIHSFGVHSQSQVKLSYFSYFKSFSFLLIFLHFLIFLVTYPLSTGTSTAVIMYFISPLFTTIILCLLAQIIWSNWIFTSQSTFTSPDSTMPSGECSYHLCALSCLCFLHKFQQNNLATMSCPPLCFLCAILFHSMTMGRIVPPFFHTSYKVVTLMICQMMRNLACLENLFMFFRSAFLIHVYVYLLILI